MSASVHVPVMLREVLQQLDLEPGLTVVDGTVGAGGHSRKISEQIGETGVLIGLDRDSMMLNFAAERVSGAGRHLIQSSYSEIKNVLHELGIDTVDRILLDLGLSSDQLADRQRGFGYSVDAPLDMRFDNRSGQSVAEFLASVDQAKLTEILTTYGEEKFSEAIAQRIVERRRKQPIKTTRDLTETVEEAIPARFRQQSRKDPSTRVFQALRIAVNQELTHLEQALQTELYEALAPGGRLSIITFHSLEDRLVKNAFRDESRWKVLAKKPTAPTPAEVRMNPRSRSAKLRTAAKL
ncbi:MAG: 16S rRNA (cytosine1402-N4)-methyltransferase [Planctomycetaceae bacterium]